MAGKADYSLEEYFIDWQIPNIGNAGATGLTVVPIPQDGMVTEIGVCPQNTIAGALATLTASLIRGGVTTALTNGAVTVPLNATIGQVFLARPSAANVAKGDSVSVQSGGGPAGTNPVAGYIKIKR